MELTVLGRCAAAVPGPGDAGSGYLVRHGGDRILLDCGNGVLGNLVRHVDDLADVDALALSHLHFDHLLDLVPLALRFRFYGEVLPIHGPPETADLLGAFLDLVSSDPQAYLDVLDVHPWEARKARDVAGFQVTPVPVVHNIASPFGLRVERDGAVLAYSGDSGPTPALVELARDADLLLCEATVPGGVDWGDARDNHLTPTQAAEVAREAGVERLLLTHVLYDVDHDALREEAAEVFPDVDVAGLNRSYRIG